MKVTDDEAPLSARAQSNNRLVGRLFGNFIAFEGKNQTPVESRVKGEQAGELAPNAITLCSLDRQMMNDTGGASCVCVCRVRFGACS